MNTRELIDSLARDAGKVRAVPRPAISAIAWLVPGCFFAIALSLSLFGLRQDIERTLGNWHFWATTLSLACLAFSAGFVGILASLPGRGGQGRGMIGVRVSVLLYFACLAVQLLDPVQRLEITRGFAVGGVKCSLSLLLLSVLPGVVYLLMLKRRAPVHPTLSARMMGLAMAALGSIGLNFHCSENSVVHQVLYHGLPIFIFAIVVSRLGRRLLRW
jgi:hypothetical protein